VEVKLTLMMLRRTLVHALLASILIGLLTYGIALLASLAYAGLTMVKAPFGMHAITSNGSLMPFTGMVPMSLSYALSQLGIRNTPIVMALALVDYRYVVMVVGLNNITGPVCIAGSIVGVKPGLHLLTSYVRQVTVPISVVVRGSEPFLMCNINYTMPLSNVGYGAATMILIPNEYWGRVEGLVRRGINITIVNTLNETVDLKYGYLGLGYLVNYGPVKPGVNIVNLPLNYYVIYAVLNGTPIPIGEAPRELTMTINPPSKPSKFTRQCTLTVNSPSDAEVSVVNGSGVVLVIRPGGNFNVTLPCGSYVVTAYRGGEFFTTRVNITGSTVVNASLVSFTGELAGIEGSYSEYARSYFRGLEMLYASFVVLLAVAVGLTSAGLLGLVSMIRVIAWAIGPIAKPLQYVATLEYARRVVSTFTLILASVMCVVSWLIYGMLLNIHTILIIRQPMELSPVITLPTAVAASLSVWLTLVTSLRS